MRSSRGSESKREYWRKHIAAQQHSGLSIRAYAQQHGLQEPAFYWWRRALRPAAEASVGAPAFVPVHIESKSGIEIVVRHGLIVRVLTDADVAVAVRLIQALESASC